MSELETLAQNLNIAIPFMKSLVQNALEYADVSRLIKMDINDFFLHSFRSALQPLEITVHKLWIGKALTLREYTGKELPYEIRKVVTIMDITPFCALHFELDLEFAKKHVEAILEFYVDDQERVEVRGHPWVQECYYDWKEDIEKIIEGYGPLLFTAGLQKVLKKISFEKRTKLQETIGPMLLKIESNPGTLLTMDLFEEIQKSFTLDPMEIAEAKKTLFSILEEYAKGRTGVPIEENTKKFLANELLYSLLKLKVELEE